MAQKAVEYGMLCLQEVWSQPLSGSLSTTRSDLSSDPEFKKNIGFGASVEPPGRWLGLKSREIEILRTKHFAKYFSVLYNRNLSSKRLGVW